MTLVFAYDREIKNDTDPFAINSAGGLTFGGSVPYEFSEQLNVAVPSNGWDARDAISDLLYIDKEYMRRDDRSNELERNWFFKLFEDTLKKNQKAYKLLTVDEALKTKQKFIYIIAARFWYLPSLIPISIYRNNPFKLILKKILTAINEGQCFFILQATKWPFSPEKDIKQIQTLYLLLKHAGVKNYDNVFLLTSTEGSDQQHLTPIKSLFWEHFESALMLSTKETTSYETKLQNCLSDSSFKRFLYLNHKERAHRLYLYYKICTKIADFHEKFAASFCPGAPLFETSQGHYKFYSKFFRYVQKLKDPELPLWFVNPTTKEEFFSNLLKTQNIKSLSLSCDIAEWNDKTWRTETFQQWTLFASVWEKTGIYIGCETKETNGVDQREFLTLTEKTFKPIVMKSPFLIFGQPGVLKKLKSYGYKTFSELWDESYDNEVNIVKRTNLLIKTIEYLNNLSNIDFYNLLLKAQDIVEYNYNHMMKNRYTEKHIYEKIEEFYAN